MAKLQSFARANLSRRDLRNQNFDGVDFSEANLAMADMEGVSCEPLQVKKLNQGVGSFLVQVLGGGGNEQYYQIVEAHPTNFSNAELSGANLRYAKLNGAEFYHAKLRQANLSRAEMTGIILVDADLTNANLAKANLTNAILYKANLECADLTGAILDGADLENANLHKAILDGVDLRNAKNLDKADMSEVNLSKAVLPAMGEYMVSKEQPPVDPVAHTVWPSAESFSYHSAGIEKKPISTGLIPGEKKQNTHDEQLFQSSPSQNLNYPGKEKSTSVLPYIIVAAFASIISSAIAAFVSGMLIAVQPAMPEDIGEGMGIIICGYTLVSTPVLVIITSLTGIPFSRWMLRRKLPFSPLTAAILFGFAAGIIFTAVTAAWWSSTCYTGLLSSCG
jgi:uncharacterized protein YjbI with pentapeptide repeats